MFYQHFNEVIKRSFVEVEKLWELKTNGSRGLKLFFYFTGTIITFFVIAERRTKKMVKLHFACQGQGKQSYLLHYENSTSTHMDTFDVSSFAGALFVSC